MTMITKCPACGTAFRVTPQQLQAQHGMVRCGRCAKVFDGFKDLATQRDHSPVEAVAPAVAVHDVAGSAQVSTQPPGDVLTSAPALQEAASRFEPAPPASRPAVMVTITDDTQSQARDLPSAPWQVEPATPTPHSAEAGPISGLQSPTGESPSALAQVEPATTPPQSADANPTSDRQSSTRELPSTPSGIKPATPRPKPAVVTPELQATHVEYPAESAPVARRSAGLTLGMFLLLLALAAQGIYFYRGDIAAYVPETRPYLERICEHLRCTVALPQRPRAISIEASDLQATDLANPGVIMLTATLRNHAATALGYPALDVVLTNAKEHTVARRIFLPADYLDSGKDARAGIPPNAEITVKLDIDSGDLGAAGFRIDLLAAPER